MHAVFKPALLIRIALGAVFCAAFAAIAIVLFSGDGPAAHPDIPVFLPVPGAEKRPATSEDCKACHPSEHGQWSGSRHSGAWTNPQVAAYAALSLGIEDCVRCHAPMPVFQNGIDREPVQRTSGRDSGVDCLTCHGSPGGIVGPKGNAAAPCRPVGDLNLAKSAVCAGCHRTIGLDWRESPAARAGKQCQDCHMQDGALSAGKKRTHLMRGARSRELLDSAFSMQAAVERRALEVSVGNPGAGHNFPGERHFRSLWISVLWKGGDERGIEEERRAIKEVNPIRQARPGAMIKAGAKEVFRFSPCAGAESARVRLLYKFYPSDLEAEALVLDELEVQLVDRGD